MDKVKRVAVAEYLNSVRSKAFIISILMMPLIIGLSVTLQLFAAKKIDMTPRRVAVVDYSGKLFATIKQASDARNQSLKSKPEPPDKVRAMAPSKPPYAPFLHDPGDTPREELELQLSSRVRGKDLFAFVIIGENVFAVADEDRRGVSYFTQTPTFMDLPRWLENTINGELRRVRLLDAGLDQALIAKLSRRAPFDRRGLAKKTKTGKIQKAKKEDPIRTMVVPLVTMLVMFVTVMTTAPMLMNTVLEEKMNKVSEVLISSVSPVQLMFGKLVGCVLVSLTLSGLYILSIVISLKHLNYLYLVPTDLVGWFFLFQVMAGFIYGAMFMAVGSACNEIRDAQSLMTPVMLMGMAPMLVWLAIVQAPNSPFSQVMSLIPPFTPVLMMIRLASPAGPAMWELALALVLTGAFMFFCIWAAAKIFRIGILAQGQSPSLFKLLSWIWSK